MFVFRIQNKFDKNGPFHTEGNTDAFLKENGIINPNSHKHIGLMNFLTDDEYDHLRCGFHIYFFDSLERLFSVFKVIDKKLFMEHWEVLSIDISDIGKDYLYILEDEQVAISKNIVSEKAFVINIEKYKEYQKYIFS